jgi:putative holliday junction resolvase
LETGTGSTNELERNFFMNPYSSSSSGNHFRVMGLDIGERRIGIAVSDALGWTAQGVEVIDRKTTDWIQRVGQLIQAYEIYTLVVGFPRNMDGSIGPRGELSKRIADELEVRFSLPVVLWDERLSTSAVERMLIEADVSRGKRKHIIDKIAAAWILQGYLDAQREVEK